MSRTMSGAKELISLSPASVTIVSGDGKALKRNADLPQPALNNDLYIPCSLSYAPCCLFNMYCHLCKVNIVINIKQITIT